MTRGLIISQFHSSALYLAISCFSKLENSFIDHFDLSCYNFSSFSVFVGVLIGRQGNVDQLPNLETHPGPIIVLVREPLSSKGS